MAGLSLAVRESSTASLTDDSSSSSGSCIVVATAAEQTSHTTSTTGSSEEAKGFPMETTRTRKSLRLISPLSLGISNTTKNTTNVIESKLGHGRTETQKSILANETHGGQLCESVIKLAGDANRERRKSNRLESSAKEAISAVASTASVLGKRSRDALEGSKEKLKVIQGRRKSLRPMVKDGSAFSPKERLAQISGKKAGVSILPSPSSSANIEMPKAEVNRPYRPRKRYLASGLYVGQASDFDARLSEKKNQIKRASKATQEAAKPERTYLPMPMYGGKRLLDSGRFFKLPFDVYSPLPPGQPKPDEWRKTQSNRFVGDSVLEWKKLKPLEASCCLCTPESGCDDNCQNRYMLYECDDTNCNIGAQWCTNRAFADLKERHKRGNKYDIGVDVIKTAAKGFGVRANRTFEPNQIIVEYAGEIITQEEAERRMMNEYKNNECYYLMMFDQNMIIDGTRGSIARFVNHSCEPNCRIVKWIVAGKPRMALFAGDDGIMTGEELTYDYNFDPFSQKNVQACKCGAPSCRGVLGPRPKERDSSKVSKSESTPVKAKRKAEKPANTEPAKKKQMSGKEKVALQVTRVVAKTPTSKTGATNATTHRSPIDKENITAKRKSKESLIRKTPLGRHRSVGKENVTMKKAIKDHPLKKSLSTRVEKRRHTINALSRTTSNIKRTAAVLKNSTKTGSTGACKPTTIEMYFSRA